MALEEEAVGGPALVRLLVEADGVVSEVEIVESRGKVLDAAVRRAAFGTRFQPALRDGRPVRARILLEVPLGPEQSGESSPSPTVLEMRAPAPEAAGGSVVEVVVTGSRVPERRGEGVVPTQVISRADLRRSGATTVGAALEAEPGLQVERTFRGTEVWIRGLDPEYTLILLDGQRLPGRVGGAVDLSRYPLENVERIEIVRGPSSALYGSDAIGGTINIITRESDARLEADAEARVGTNDGVLGNARVAGRPFGAFGVALSGGHQHTAAYRSEPDAVATTGSARRLDTAGASLSFGSAADSRLRLSADYSQNRLDGVDEGTGGAVFDRTQLQEQAALSGLFTQKSGDLSLSASAQYTQFREQYLNDQRQSTALDRYEDNREHQGLSSVTAAYGWSDDHRTTFGGEVLAQILDSERLSDSGFRVRYALFAEHRWTMARAVRREVLAVVPGARVDIDSQFGDQISPKLALRYEPVKEVTLRAGYGRGFRAPSFQELLLRFENPAVGYVVLGNPELGPESSHSVDVSGEWRPSREWFLSLALFRNDLSNMIATVTEADPDIVGTVFTYGNIARAWTMGVESQGVWAPHELLTLTLGYTLMGTENEATGLPLEGRPLHRFNFRLLSVYSEWGLEFMARGSLALDRTFSTTENDGSLGTLYADPLFQLDVRIAKSFTRHFELFVGATNLADAGDDYAGLLPRQFYAGLGGHY